MSEKKGHKLAISKAKLFSSYSPFLTLLVTVMLNWIIETSWGELQILLQKSSKIL